MLVLSRKLEESIQIDDNITIKVLEVRGGQVRLGIEAPRSVNIIRSELMAEPTAKREANGEAHREPKPSKVSAAV